MKKIILNLFAVVLLQNVATAVSPWSEENCDGKVANAICCQDEHPGERDAENNVCCQSLAEGLCAHPGTFKLFSLLDKEGNGLIDSNYLFNLIKSAGLSSLNDRQLRKKIDQADTDGNGGLDMTEFIKFEQSNMKDKTETDFDFAFKKFDKNGDGIISKREFIRKMRLGTLFADRDLNKAFNEIDANRDGHISLEEFANIDQILDQNQRGFWCAVACWLRQRTVI